MDHLTAAFTFCIHVGSKIQEQIHDLQMTLARSHRQGIGRCIFVIHTPALIIHQAGVRFQHLLDTFQITKSTGYPNVVICPMFKQQFSHLSIRWLITVGAVAFK